MTHISGAGGEADVVRDGPNTTVRYVLRLQQPPAVVIRTGKVLARNELDRTLSVRSA